MRLAREVLKMGGTYPAAYNMANEKAVERFLLGKISFPKIANEVECALKTHKSLDPFSLDDLLSITKLS